MAITKIPTFRPVNKPTESPEAKTREAAKMYEEHFLNEMVKAMRQSVDRSKLTDASIGQNYYTEQLDQQYVKNWSEQGGVGLADIIYNQLNERFFQQQAPKPQGPLPVQPGTRIKIDESRLLGIPVVTPAGTVNDELSFIYEWDDADPARSEVKTPWEGKVLQSYKVGDNRQVMKIEHDNGLVSTVSYLGNGRNLNVGDSLSSGDIVGRLDHDARGLTWQVAKVEPFIHG